MGIEIVNEDVPNTDNGRMAIFGIGTYNRDFSIDYKNVYCGRKRHTNIRAII